MLCVTGGGTFYLKEKDPVNITYQGITFEIKDSLLEGFGAVNHGDPKSNLGAFPRELDTHVDYWDQYPRNLTAPSLESLKLAGEK